MVVVKSSCKEITTFCGEFLEDLLWGRLLLVEDRYLVCTGMVSMIFARREDERYARFL